MAASQLVLEEFCYNIIMCEKLLYLFAAIHSITVLSVWERRPASHGLTCFLCGRDGRLATASPVS